jgi:hypothetical protein
MGFVPVEVAYVILITPLVLWVGLMIFIATRKRWPWGVRGICLCLIVGFPTFGFFLPAYLKEQRYKQAEAEASARRQVALPYFYEQCAKDSGRFVYKPVEMPQESVYIMKPRKSPSAKDLQDQFWMGDPYAGVYYLSWMESRTNPFPMMNEAKRFTGTGDANRDKWSRIPYFSFVEMLDLYEPNRLWRYTYEPTGAQGRKELTRVPIDATQSRYGFTWEDLSTPEDRQHWVAKSRLQIIDLQNHEVIAERIGYLIEWSIGMGKEMQEIQGGWSGWAEASRGANSWKRLFCPPRSKETDEDWIRSVLLNVPFDE